MKKKVKVIRAYARQGEIIIFKVKNSPRPTWFKPVSMVVREGEKSGHKHEIEGQANLFANDEERKEDGMRLEVGEKGAEMNHPEHPQVKFEPNAEYDIHIQREHDPKKPVKAKD